MAKRKGKFLSNFFRCYYGNAGVGMKTAGTDRDSSGWFSLEEGDVSMVLLSLCYRAAIVKLSSFGWMRRDGEMDGKGRKDGWEWRVRGVEVEMGGDLVEMAEVVTEWQRNLGRLCDFGRWFV